MFLLEIFRVVNVVFLGQIYVLCYEELCNYVWPFSILPPLAVGLRDLQDLLLHPPECAAPPGGLAGPLDFLAEELRSSLKMGRIPAKD